MKRIQGMIVAVLLLIAGTSLNAQEITVTNTSVAAGGMVDMELGLNGEANSWGGLQMDVTLPDGISILADEYGYYYEVTERLMYKARTTKEFDVKIGEVDGKYRIIVANGDYKTIPGTEGALLKLRLVCEPTMVTGEYGIGISGQILSNVDGSSTKHLEDNAGAATLTVRMDVNIGSTGYATYSWPMSLDFTNAGVEAYIATAYKDGWLHLEPVNVVPASTGIILKGASGTYHPITATSQIQDDTSANLLGSTVDAPVTATDDSNLYALANKNDKVGFYHVKNGVKIPQYKAYLELPVGAEVREFVGFEEIATGLTPSTTTSDNEQWIHVDGTVSPQPRKGINIKQGHKILIK